MYTQVVSGYLHRQVAYLVPAKSGNWNSKGRQGLWLDPCAWAYQGSDCDRYLGPVDPRRLLKVHTSSGKVLSQFQVVSTQVLSDSWDTDWTLNLFSFTFLGIVRTTFWPCKKCKNTLLESSGVFPAGEWFGTRNQQIRWVQDGARIVPEDFNLCA